MKQCDIDDDSENEKRQSPVPMANPPFFGMEKNALDVDRVGPSHCSCSGVASGFVLFSHQDVYYRARATIDVETGQKSELADSVAGRKMCVMSVVMFTGILPVLWSCAIYCVVWGRW